MYCWKDSASADASPVMLTSGPVPESVEPLLLPELVLVPLEDAPELLPVLPELDPDVAPLPLPLPLPLDEELDPADDDEPPLVPDEDDDPDEDEEEEDELELPEPPESSPKTSTPPAFWLLHPTVTASDRKANDPTNRFAKAIRMTSSTRQVPKYPHDAHGRPATPPETCVSGALAAGTFDHSANGRARPGAPASTRRVGTR